MKKLLLAGVCLTAWVGSAVAADMAVKAPVYTPSYSWTGCYGGFNFGSLFAKKDWTIAGSFESSYDVTDLLIGGQLGCNYQLGSWVLGIQGDYDWINATGTGAGQFTGLTDRTHITSLSSVTGRFGYALDRWLPYVRAGGAWEHAKFDAFDANNAVVGTASGTRSGFTVGGGLEYAIVSNLSIFIEYNWYDFGTRTTTFTGVFPATSIRERDSAVKVGLNWKFLPW